MLTVETYEQYAAARKDHLTSHQLADFRSKGPRHYYRQQRGLIQDKDSAALIVGRATHKFILEGPEAFCAEYLVGGPINPKTGKGYGRDTQKFRDWVEENGGLEAITEEDFHLIELMWASVQENPVAMALLGEAGQVEGVARAEYGGLPCQARVDWFHETLGIVDFKTCRDLTWFENDARRYGYGHQVAFYRALVDQVTGSQLPVHLIAVEKEEPYRCGVWHVQNELLEICAAENREAMQQLLNCIEEDHFPSGFEEVRQFGSL